MTAEPRDVEGRCGFTIIDKDGLEQPCDRPATGWRWYQDCDHEDTLDVACDRHENEGGRRLAAADQENAELRELLGIEKWSRDIGPANIREVAATAVRRIVAAERDDLRAQLAAAQAQLAEAQTALTIIRVWANTKHGGVKTPAEVWPGLNAALSAAPQPEPDRRRDWMRPTAEMTELENVGGATLKRACIDLGLPTWGTKKKIAGHLLDVGMTAGLVRARWSWRALHDNPEPPASDEPARCDLVGELRRASDEFDKLPMNQRPIITRRPTPEAPR